jgi:CIC family chloride channel protein
MPVPLTVLSVSMLFGVATGVLVYLFTYLFLFSERLAKVLVQRGGYPLMLLVGGLILGVIGFISPMAVGPGFGVLPILLSGSILNLIFSLFFRQLSTSFTMSFGGTGGLFFPTLIIGGTWGAILSTLIAPDMMPMMILMGMASFSAGVHKMMLTPIIFIAEVFGSYTLIPIILSTVVCFFISGTSSFYPIQPKNKVADEELALERFYYKVTRDKPKELERLLAKDIYTINPVSLDSEKTIREALDEFGKTPFRLLPVIDRRKHVLGYVTLENLALLSKTTLDIYLKDIELQNASIFKENSPIMQIIEDMINHEESHCFIVDDMGRLTGIISTIDVTRLLMRYFAHY